MDRRRGALLIVVAGFASPIVSATSVTYDFTGLIYDTVGAYTDIPDGTAVTGSFTLDYAAIVPGQGSGTLGSSQPWSVASNGGVFTATPLPSSVVFSMTVTVDGVTYGPPPANPPEIYSAVDGTVDALAASNQTYIDSSHSIESLFALGASNSNTPAYFTNGLPNLSAIQIAYSQGAFYSFTGSVAGVSYDAFKYDLDSLTPAPVPLPATTWLLISGLAGLGMWSQAARRQRR